MERESEQKNPSHLTTTTTTIEEEYPRKSLIGGSLGGGGGGDNNASGSGGGGGGGGGGGDRLKRDEWSEGAVSSLLEAYESKWVMRNRAKLKGHDWEDVARYVSSRANCTKSPKTQTQCKNKIESMKKRYRSESASSDHYGSSWPLYSRLDLLLRGSGPTTTTTAAPPPPLPLPPPPPPPPPPPQFQEQPLPPFSNPHLMLLEPSQVVVLQPPQPLPPPVPVHLTARNSQGSDSFGKAKEDCEGTKLSENATDTDSSSTPALYSENKEKQRELNKKKAKVDKNRKRKRNEELVGIAGSIKWLAEVVVRSERARMETMKEIEKMRMESEAKRSEMDLKRTEIIANTQLEIARLCASAIVGKSGGSVGGGVDSSLRIGRS